MNWSANDALARRMFAEGHAFENVAEAFFRAHGLQVERPPREVRDTFADRGRFAGETDLVVCGKKIELKSRRIEAWPSKINLCSMYSWRYKKSVDAWVMLSQLTGEMICTSGVAARRFGIVEKSRDSRRDIDEYSIIRLDSEHFKSIIYLIKWLKGEK